MAFIGLLVVLFLGQVCVNESFYNFKDSSGADVSGNITLSFSDLLALLGSGASKEEEKEEEDDYDYSTNDKYYRNMRADMMSDVKNAVRNELLYGKYSDLYNGDMSLEDSCIDSFSSKQGADFMKYIPGKNPDDYIRKDSVPCYGCSVP
jgi:hypothetical protein